MRKFLKITLNQHSAADRSAWDSRQRQAQRRPEAGTQAGTARDKHAQAHSAADTAKSRQKSTQTLRKRTHAQAHALQISRKTGAASHSLRSGRRRKSSTADKKSAVIDHLKEKRKARSTPGRVFMCSYIADRIWLHACDLCAFLWCCSQSLQISGHLIRQKNRNPLLDRLFCLCCRNNEKSGQRSLDLAKPWFLQPPSHALGLWNN